MEIFVFSAACAVYICFQVGVIVFYGVAVAQEVGVHLVTGGLLVQTLSFSVILPMCLWERPIWPPHWWHRLKGAVTSSGLPHDIVCHGEYIIAIVCVGIFKRHWEKNYLWKVMGWICAWTGEVYRQMLVNRLSDRLLWCGNDSRQAQISLFAAHFKAQHAIHHINNRSFVCPNTL